MVAVWRWSPAQRHAINGPQDTGSHAAAPPGVNEVVGLKLTCRGIIDRGTANQELAYTCSSVDQQPSFTNAILGDPYNDQDTNTFKFDVSVDLRHRFKLALAPKHGLDQTKSLLRHYCRGALA